VQIFRWKFIILCPEKECQVWSRNLPVPVPRILAKSSFLNQPNRHKKSKWPKKTKFYLAFFKKQKKAKGVEKRPKLQICPQKPKLPTLRMADGSIAICNSQHNWRENQSRAASPRLQIADRRTEPAADLRVIAWLESVTWIEPRFFVTRTRVTFFTEWLDWSTINDSRLESESFLQNLWASDG